jgi:hypothetical protein
MCEFYNGFALVCARCEEMHRATMHILPFNAAALYARRGIWLLNQFEVRSILR